MLPKKPCARSTRKWVLWQNKAVDKDCLGGYNVLNNRICHMASPTKAAFLAGAVIRKSGESPEHYPMLYVQESVPFRSDSVTGETWEGGAQTQDLPQCTSQNTGHVPRRYPQNGTFGCCAKKDGRMDVFCIHATFLIANRSISGCPGIPPSRDCPAGDDRSCKERSLLWSIFISKI